MPLVCAAFSCSIIKSYFGCCDVPNRPGASHTITQRLTPIKIQLKYSRTYLYLALCASAVFTTFARNLSPQSAHVRTRIIVLCDPSAGVHCTCSIRELCYMFLCVCVRVCFECVHMHSMVGASAHRTACVFARARTRTRYGAHTLVQ